MHSRSGEMAHTFSPGPRATGIYGFRNNLRVVRPFPVCGAGYYRKGISSAKPA